MTMKTIVLLAALSPTLALAAEPQTYECGYLEGAAGSVTVTVEPAGCTVDIGAVTLGDYKVKVSVGGGEVTFSFTVAEPASAPH